MKYLSVVLLALLMIWTWFIVHIEPSVSFETHADMQNQLANLIIDTIKSKKPQSSGIQINSLWTEPVSSDKGQKVKAHFSYRYHEPTTEGGMTESVINGTLDLNKKSEDQSGLEKWTISKVHTTNSSLTFDESYVITIGDSPEDEESDGSIRPETQSN